MTGYTQKHGKGWRYRIEFDPNPNGKRKTISKSGFKKESEAKKALIKKLNEINDGKYIEDNGLTVKNNLFICSIVAPLLSVIQFIISVSLSVKCI